MQPEICNQKHATKNIHTQEQKTTYQTKNMQPKTCTQHKDTQKWHVSVHKMRQGERLGAGGQVAGLLVSGIGLYCFCPCALTFPASLVHAFWAAEALKHRHACYRHACHDTHSACIYDWGITRMRQRTEHSATHRIHYNTLNTLQHTECVMAPIWILHITCEWVTLRMQESCHIYMHQWVTLDINESCQIWTNETLIRMWHDLTRYEWFIEVKIAFIIAHKEII